MRTSLFVKLPAGSLTLFIVNPGSTENCFSTATRAALTVNEVMLPL